MMTFSFFKTTDYRVLAQSARCIYDHGQPIEFCVAWSCRTGGGW